MSVTISLGKNDIEAIVVHLRAVLDAAIEAKDKTVLAVAASYIVGHIGALERLGVVQADEILKAAFKKDEP